MKIISQSLLIGIVVLASAASTATAQTADAHKIVSPQEIKWGPAPASLPPGAELAVLYGDPSKEGVFAMRLKAAKGYYIPPHTHPRPEINTVISGTVRLGMGETADHSKAQPLPAGSFFALSPGMAHSVFFDEDTVVQVNTSGPWGINYVNPKDDPRQHSQ
jgi:quercetin dioxygenase-like cupin family protein